MRVCGYRSKQVMKAWPEQYWQELGRKLSDRGHELVLVTDQMSESEAGAVIDACEWYVGPPGSLYEYAGRKKKRRAALLGASFKGEGIKTPLVCGGCLEKIQPPPVDCFFEDEICLREITPNDVLEYMCV